jgi:TonB family protein
VILRLLAATLFASLLASGLAAAAKAPVVDKCPLRVAGFSLLGHGQTGHIDRFVIALLLVGRDPVSANLEIPGLDNDVLTPVIGPDAGGAETLVHYVIDVPSAAGARGIRITGLIVHGSADSSLTCHSPMRLVSEAPGSAAASFDDSALPGSSLLFLRPVTEARVLRSSSAAYPSADFKLKHHGAVVVAVTVGTHGAVLRSRVETSSGYPGLDDAAVAAARLTQFSEPQLNGVAIPLDYLVRYNFALH